MKGAMRFTQAPAFKYRVKGGRGVVDTYDHAHRAFTVGLIAEFYCGTRSDDDDTIIWLIDGIEYPRAEYAAVRAHLDALAAAAGVAEIQWGPWWCGYRGVVMLMTDGRRIEQRWDGAAGRSVVDVTGADGAPVVAA